MVSKTSLAGQSTPLEQQLRARLKLDRTGLNPSKTACIPGP